MKFVQLASVNRIKALEGKNIPLPYVQSFHSAPKKGKNFSQQVLKPHNFVKGVKYSSCMALGIRAENLAIKRIAELC